MSRKQKKDNLNQDMQAKGTMCLVGGFLLLFVPLPVLGHALRPFSWVLIIVGVVLLAMPSFIEKIRQQVNNLESGNQSGTPNPFSSGRPTAQPSKWAAKDSTQFRRSQSGSRAEPTFDEKRPALDWSTQVFRDVEWRRFEAVCELLFCQAGFTAKTQSHGADGGVDIWLYSRNAVGPAAIVQCKHWRNKPVGVRELREFYGVMASQKLSRGTYATSSVFTADALRFAKENGINAMDGTKLLAQIGLRNPEQQQALLNVAYEGEYWRQTCASCGIKMVERGKPSNRFWGCANFPRCKNVISKAAD